MDPLPYHELTDLKNDYDYLLLEKQKNNNYSNYQTTNYRNYKCKTNFHNGPFTRKDLQQYNGLGVSNGYVGGCNILDDDRVTRPLIHSKPLDKNFERIERQRYRHQTLPTNINYNGICNNKFESNTCMYTSTTVPVDPQRNIDPTFDRIGINTRNYNRKDSSHYKNIKTYNLLNTIGQHGRYTKRM